MSHESPFLKQEVYNYLLDVSLREHPSLERLRLETDLSPHKHMRAAADQAQFLQFILKLIRATRVLELGTFTGYSTLAMALALPKNGCLITCEKDPAHLPIAKKYWHEAGVESFIRVELGDATKTLESLIERKEPLFDVVFVDADKQNYPLYYEQALTLLKPGGVVVLDNVLWLGRWLSEDDGSEAVAVLRKLNDFILQDARVDLSMLPIGGGMTLVRKKN